MPGRAIVDLGQLTGWLPATDGARNRQDDLTRCLDAACDRIERKCCQRFLSNAYSAWHSGDRAVGKSRELLYLADPETGWATRRVTAITELTEDGAELPIILLPDATTFADGEAAVVYAAQGKILRALVDAGKIVPKPWAYGVANIHVAYTAGYELADVPDDLRQLAIELALLYFREGARQGQTSLNVEGVSLGYERLLRPEMRDVLRSYWQPVPQTAER
ncbi:MAG TPA: hypothetical protein PKK95_09235 [Vicinamibacterales bacterium]|nr:hypothetical protein [Vicinamibacterales bacterium]